MTVSTRALLVGLGALSVWAAAAPDVLAQEAPAASTDDEIVVTGSNMFKSADRVQLIN